jgi:type IX secretion system PorP/SprF family membrane protein
LYLNPAFAGTAYYPRFTINFRDQWPSVPQTYLTYGIAYDQFFSGINSGIGLIAMADDEGSGIQKTISFSGIYTYSITLGDKLAMNVGAQATFIQKRLDWDKLKFYDQIDPIFGFTDAGNNPNPTSEVRPDNNKISMVDFSAGALLFSNSFYAGVAVKHLSQPTQSYFDNPDSRLPMRLSAHVGGLFEFGSRMKDKTKIVPSVMFVQQKNFQQINVGSYFDKGIFYGGFWFRHTFGNADAAIVVAGVNKNVFSIGYSYDFTLSKFAKETGGAHEISLVIILNTASGKKESRRLEQQIQCPSSIF